MEKLTNFSIFKNDKKDNDSQPDYHLTHFDKETQQATRVGVGWIRESSKGTKFISVSLEKPYQDRPGFELTTYQNDEAETETGVNTEDTPF